MCWFYFPDDVAMNLLHFCCCGELPRWPVVRWFDLIVVGAGAPIARSSVAVGMGVLARVWLWWAYLVYFTTLRDVKLVDVIAIPFTLGTASVPILGGGSF